MKKYLLLFLIFLIAENIQLTAQSYYGYTYTDSPTAPPSVIYAIIESCTDGSLIGTDYGNSTDNFALFRIGHDGGMLWKKMITLPGITVLTPYEICLLKDSTVVVMVRDFQINNTFYLIKFDLNGTTIWANAYTATGDSPLEMAATEGGNFVVNRSNGITWISSSGIVQKSISFSGLFSWDMVYLGEGTVRMQGTTGSPAQSVMFDIDSTGTVSNNWKQEITSDTLSGGTVIPYQILSASPDGGTYSIIGLESVSGPYFGFLYSNAQNEAVWGKKIPDAFNPRNIYATGDNGCMITADYSTGGNNLVCKFDSAGSLEWMKSPSGPGLTTFVYIETIAPDASGGWYCAMPHPDGLQIFHTDSAFSNGYCSSLNLSFQTPDLIINNTPFSIPTSPHTITQNAISVTESYVPWYRFDACTGQPIDTITGLQISPESLTLTLFPNPATESVTVEIPEHFTTGTISIFNSTGSKISETGFSGNSSVRLNVDQLKSGVYFIETKSSEKVYRGKLLIGR